MSDARGWEAEKILEIETVWTMMDNGPDFLFPRGRVVSIRTLLQLLPNKSGTDQAESDQDSRK